MGKPIAGRNKSPFGVSGIVVDAAVLSDGTKLTNVRISKQRSINVFDLISADGLTVYPFVKITGVDKTGANLNTSASASALADALPNGTFCISIANASGVVSGFAVRLLLNKVVLQDGSVVFLDSYSSQGVIAVASVSLNKITSAILVNGTEQLTATVLPAGATNKSVTWSSSAPSIATVSSTGLVTGVSNGSATITATTVDGSKTATCAYTVTTAVQSVAFANKTATVAVGSTVEDSTAITPSNASNLTRTFTSSDPTVATVAPKAGATHIAVITGVKAGTATITVTTADGSKTDTVVVTVTA